MLPKKVRFQLKKYWVIWLNNIIKGFFFSGESGWWLRLRVHESGLTSILDLHDLSPNSTFIMLLGMKKVFVFSGICYMIISLTQIFNLLMIL